VETIVVYVEHGPAGARRASLETLGAAAGTGARVVAATADPLAKEAIQDMGRALGSFGAAEVVHFSGAPAYSPDGLAADLARLVRERGARAVLAAANARGRDLMPRVAALLESSPLSDCIEFSLVDGRFSGLRPILAGKALARVACPKGVFCATLRPNVFKVRESAASAPVQTVPTQGEQKVVVTDVAAKEGAKLDVKEAPVVVSGGRGLKEPQHFKLIEDLAAAFGDAAVGASRAVVDAGWRPHSEQVGQTGKTVAPKLYIAVGISGAIQHLAGMRTSHVIVAINKDKDAPIFKIADYGIVGDAFEIVPELTAAVRAIKARA
jgi:electron transfer flavoprotein alpha subunit